MAGAPPVEIEQEAIGSGAGAIDGGFDVDEGESDDRRRPEFAAEVIEPEIVEPAGRVLDADLSGAEEGTDEEEDREFADRHQRGDREDLDGAELDRSDEAEDDSADREVGVEDEEPGRQESEGGAGRGRERTQGRRQERDDRRRYRDDRRTSEIEPGSAPPPTKPGVMVVNDTPGEECRIAILREGVLEQLFMERATTATQVGNIYKGRVTNVEPAIQAAFVDYGQGQAGFLHISDLHPKYFPRGDKTERVGKKIPRRDRPLMQEALRRGDEVIVQVLKQGLGTKGPTLTSYLSIAGRLLVMMPWMDKSGVSRKVDDEDQRREMRQILDSLNLPDGFGFILRTAGFDRTKLELQRDAAYLLRLWKVMEKRMHAVGAPCALYTESDLLIRTIRDVVDSSIDTIVVDSESAFTRARTFLEVVAPRSAPKVLHYDRQMPIFHAFDIERQIELTHSRIVPLPSGGALVIDQTEALVAIDVNSGKSRAARDSETNAYQTNIEAVAEIARQLRLRDLGGVVICDLIDMRSQRHRRDIEERFRQHLRRDRARATTAPISDFGILEMTRQRMRPSLRKTHYIDCPHCDGHGEIKMPDAVAGDALRSIAHLLHYDRVKRVEMVCSTRVASILLSGRRRMIDELEDRSEKRVEIRISEALALDRVDLYAYDDRGADIDITKLPSVNPPKLADLATEVQPRPEVEEAEEEGGGRGRRRRRRKPAPADATTIALEGGFDDLPFELEEPARPAEIAAQDGARGQGEPHPRGAEGDGSGPAPAGEARATERRGGRDRRDGRRDRRGDRGEGRGSRPATDVQAAAGGSTAREPNRAGPNRSEPRPAEPRHPIPQPQPGSDGSPGAAATAAAGTGPAGEGGDADRRRRRRRRKGGLRLGDLAREVGVPSREIVLRCRSERIFNLQDDLSRVPPDQAAMIRGWYGVAAPSAVEGGIDEHDEDDSIEGGDAVVGALGTAPVEAPIETAGGFDGERVHPADDRRPAGRGAGESGSALGGRPSDVADAKALRVFELAKELALPSKDLVARCIQESIEGVKNHMSSLTPEACAQVRSWFAVPEPVAASVGDGSEAAAAPRPERGARERRGGPDPRRDERRPATASEAGVVPDGRIGARSSVDPRPARSAGPVAQQAPRSADGAPARPQAGPGAAAAPKPSFRPLYAAGRSRKPLPAKRDADRGD